ncbi:unnamed protein product [Didymodactylos carnosus]|uniref:Transmembrane protein n=1 Tax=Didymodactylos carnosus TaxID=1234261 RepID=A0A813P0K4_9BILA|nr:unnamed protein product [Didymodactylos carnosus]CAF0855313.1 unnamed protein product [Didymodactylos carnosus]CAF3526224.1 unnamed protein product [Didymodactylos carnosus]CAF3640413.1 unnamed protein product [Didymodactylos carnosus]
MGTGTMRNPYGDTFNDITIDLRGGDDASGNNYRENGYDVDSTSAASFIARQSRYSAYPQVRPTNPLYASQSTLKTQPSNRQSSSQTSAALVARRQKFNPQEPRRPSDWRWFAILCIILFFPTGVIALTIGVGVFGYERGIEKATNYIWERNNRGKLWKEVQPSFVPKADDDAEDT